MSEVCQRCVREVSGAAFRPLGIGTDSAGLCPRVGSHPGSREPTSGPALSKSSPDKWGHCPGKGAWLGGGGWGERRVLTSPRVFPLPSQRHCGLGLTLAGTASFPFVVALLQ